MPKPTEPSKPLARIEDGYLILNDGAMWDYEIHLGCLKDESQVTQWVDHLNEKRWFSADMKAQMLGALMQGAA